MTALFSHFERKAEAMSQHNNDEADEPMRDDSSRAAHSGSSATPGRRGGGAVGRAVAAKISPGPNISERQEGRTRKETK